MRTASSTGRTKILPSPTSPVRACLRMASNASWRMNASIFFMRSALLTRLGRGHLGGCGSGWCRVPGAHRARDPGGVLRLRDELLRVPVHAVRADVEARFLLVVVHTQPDRAFDDSEGHDRYHEDDHEGEQHRQPLNAQPVSYTHLRAHETVLD